MHGAFGISNDIKTQEIRLFGITNVREFVVDSRHPGDTHACWVRVRPAVADT